MAALKPGLSSLSSSCRAKGLLQPLLAGLGDQRELLRKLRTRDIFMLDAEDGLVFHKLQSLVPTPPGSETTDGR